MESRTQLLHKDDYLRRQKGKILSKNRSTYLNRRMGNSGRTSTATSIDSTAQSLELGHPSDHPEVSKTRSVLRRYRMTEPHEINSSSMSLNPQQTNPFDVTPLLYTVEKASSYSDETTDSTSDSDDDNKKDVDLSILSHLRQVFLEEVKKIGIQHFFPETSNSEDGSVLFADDHHDHIEGSEEPEDESVPASTSIPSSSSSSSNTNKDQKRKLTEDDDSGPSKNRRGKEGKKFIPIPGSGPAGRRFACYFNKHNPHVYRSRDETGLLYETCASRTFENVHRLFDHLKKIHCENPYQCPTCGTCYVESPDDYFEHVGERSCAQTEYIRIKTTTLRKIETFRSDLRQLPYQQRDTESAKWRYIFYRLFDELPINIDPYSHDPYAVLSSLQEEYVTRRLRQLSPDNPMTPRQYEYLNHEFIRDFRLRNGIPEIFNPSETTLPSISVPEIQTSSTVPTLTVAPQSITQTSTQSQLNPPTATGADGPALTQYDILPQDYLGLPDVAEEPSLPTEEGWNLVLDNFDFDWTQQQQQGQLST